MTRKPDQHNYQRKQSGAFLIIALILTVILSALGIATLSSSVTSQRVSHNYSDFMGSQERATSMAEYANRILGTYADGVYPGPATCPDDGTCNTFIAGFPHSGRPILAWTSGLPTTTINQSSQTDAWWTANGFAYEASFGVPGNSRVVVQQLGANPGSPYQRTYKIIGYASDANGQDKATYEMIHVWNGYTPDPGDGTCGGKCHYGECCSSLNICGTDQTSCESGSATYVPPGWTCLDYFVNGLGYSSSACTFPISPP